jgi:hypothetical protein
MLLDDGTRASSVISAFANCRDQPASREADPFIRSSVSATGDTVEETTRESDRSCAGTRRDRRGSSRHSRPNTDGFKARSKRQTGSRASPYVELKNEPHRNCSWTPTSRAARPRRRLDPMARGERPHRSNSARVLSTRLRGLDTFMSRWTTSHGGGRMRATSNTIDMAGLPAGPATRV